MKGKRGRPSTAAKSLDEALHAVYAWHPSMGPLPRPRNAFERQAQRRTAGAKGQANALTPRCAELAYYLRSLEGISRTAAIRKARALIEGEVLSAKAKAARAASLMASERTVGRHQVAPDEANVRRYLRRLETLRPKVAKSFAEPGFMDVTAETILEWEAGAP